MHGVLLKLKTLAGVVQDLRSQQHREEEPQAEVALSAEKKATCLENAHKVEVEVEPEQEVPEPASNVAKKDTCLASARKVEAVVELELEDPGLASSVEKKAISQENAHKEAEVAVAPGLATTAVRKGTCPETVLKKESQEQAVVAAAVAEGDHATIVAKTVICPENAHSQEMRTIVAVVAVVVEADSNLRVLDEMTSLCKKQPLVPVGVQPIIKMRPGVVQLLAVEQIGTQVHPKLKLPQVVAGERVLPLNKKLQRPKEDGTKLLQAKQSPLMNGQHLLSHNLYKTVVGAPKKKPKKSHRAIMQVINGQVHQPSRRQVVVDGVPKALNHLHNKTEAGLPRVPNQLHRRMAGGEAKVLNQPYRKKVGGVQVRALIMTTSKKLQQLIPGVTRPLRQVLLAGAGVKMLLQQRKLVEVGALMKPLKLRPRVRQ